MHYITGEAVSTVQLQRIAALLDLPMWPSEKQPFMRRARTEMPRGVAVLADKITEEKLDYLFSQPITMVLDSHAQKKAISRFYQGQKKKLDYALGFLLTCPVIYKCDVAKIFMDALQRRLNFPKDRFESIHLALHESLVNGLIHGNLEISSSFRQSTQDFIAYTRLLNERLQDPDYANKSISICASWNTEKLQITIRDEGAGYMASPTVVGSSETTERKSGRGLRMIAGTADSCVIDEAGKEITLTFLLETTAAVPTEALWETPQETKALTDLSESRVLVVEDNVNNQALVAGLLRNFGISQIETAMDGVDGLNKVVSFKPDLIILDITMPRMDGFEMLYHLKSTPETQDIPVLIQTAFDTREARDKTFRSGAADFITKPINPLEFFSRVQVHLENRLLISSLKKQLAQIGEELTTAQQMQTALLPTSQKLGQIQSKYGLEIAHYLRPSSRMGGDFWQIFPLNRNKVAIYLCDFSGHGLAAALNTFRIHTLLYQLDYRNKKPAALLENLNEKLYHLLPRGQFAAFFLAIWDKSTNEFVYSGAAYTAPFLKSGKKVRELKTRGLPLGISRNPEYENNTVLFKEGDELLLFSDALVESPTVDGQRLGQEGFLNLAKPFLSRLSSHSVLRGVLNAFFKVVPPPPPDDVTAVYMRVHATKKGER